MTFRRIILFLITSFTVLLCDAQINTERMMNVARNALYYDDYVLSISYFNIVINYRPYLHEPYFYRGLAKFYLDDYLGTVNDCTLAIKKNEYFPNSYELRGLAYINMGEYALAEKDYEISTEMQPENRAVWHNRILCNIELDNLDKADSIACIMIKKWSKYADGYNMRAQIMMQKKDTVAAEELIDKAIEADKYNVQALTVKANIRMQKEEYEDAVNFFNESLRINPKNASNLINRALCHYHLDHYRDAMKDYDLALELEPKNFVGHYNRGLLRSNVGEDNLAIEDFNFIISIDPDDMMAVFNRATLLDNIGDYKGAIRDYTTVIKEFPKFLYGYERRAQARRKIGDLAGANRDEEHILKEQIAHRFGYSTPTSRQKNKTRKKSEKNLDDYRKLVEEDDSIQEKIYESEYRGKIQNHDQEANLLTPNARTLLIYKDSSQHTILTTFDQAYQDAQAGNLQDAIAGFSKVLETDDSFAEAYFNRGLLKLLLDDKTTAIADLSKAGELGIYQAYNIIKKNQGKK